MSRIFNLTLQFTDGGHDEISKISRRKLLPPDELTRRVWPASVPDL